MLGTGAVHGGRRVLFAATAAVAVVAAAVTVAATAAADGRRPVDPRTIPFLPSGQHLGFKSFVDLPSESAATLEAMTEKAVDAGMDVGRIFYDWAELEPTLGTYEFGDMESELADFRTKGIRPTLGILVGGSDGYALPAELSDPDDGSKLAPGIRLDSPTVIRRYEKLLDRILPELVDGGAWSLALMNEPDIRLGDLAAKESAREAKAIANFTNAVSHYVHHRYPGLSVTFTMSGFSIVNPPKNLGVIVKPTDILTTNYGCLDPNTFTVTRIEDIPSEIAALKEIARGRQIVIQELSCASGWEDKPSVLAASPEYQQDWFEAFYAEMERQPSIRAAFVLDLVDWSPELGKLYSDFLRDEGLPEIADKYEELLRSWGLLRYPDLSAKPSWDSFLAAVARQTRQRQEAAANAG